MVIGECAAIVFAADDAMAAGSRAVGQTNPGLGRGPRCIPRRLGKAVRVALPSRDRKGAVHSTIPKWMF